MQINGYVASIRLCGVHIVQGDTTGDDDVHFSFRRKYPKKIGVVFQTL